MPNFDTSENYTDPKSSFTFSDIGHAKVVQRTFCGWLADKTNIGEVEYPSGPIYLSRNKNEAEADWKARVALHLEACSKDFPEFVMLVSMPIVSLTNRTDEQKAELMFPAFQNHARIVGWKKDKPGMSELDGILAQDNAYAYHLLMLPSLVDAYARSKGIYTEPLFDPGVCDGIGKTADPAEAKKVVPQLIAMRKAIWAALGEQDWKLMFETSKAPKLLEVLLITRNPWDDWVRVINVNNPASFAWRTQKELRSRVTCITQFFAGEREAIEAGKKELAERAERSGDAADKAMAGNGNLTADQLATSYQKASSTAKSTYNMSDWPDVVSAIRTEFVGIENKSQKIVDVKAAGVAKDYSVEPGDVKLIWAL